MKSLYLKVLHKGGSHTMEGRFVDHKEEAGWI
jgi:hypothetical protein